MSIPAPARPARPARTWTDSFALLAECLLTGVYVLVASLALVTVPAALAAGTAHLRRHLSGQATDLGRFARDWWAAVRELWVLGAAGTVLAAILTLNVQVAASGLLPGGPAVRWVSLAVGTVSAVVVLRVTGVWSLPDGGRGRPGEARPGGLVLSAVSSVRQDPAGSLLLVVAIGLCGLLVWMLAALSVVVGGLLCLAVIAVESRRTRSSSTVAVP
ncbi:DUF624 domain-containing protein [Myceligenerans cantabricum]